MIVARSSADGLGPRLAPNRYNLFGWTTAIRRVGTVTIGPGQRFTIASMEACSRILGRDSGVTTRWVPAYHGVTDNEKVDEYARAAAEGRSPDGKSPDTYRWETSLSHMAKAAAEARARSTNEWISSHVRAERRYRPPTRRGLQREQLRRTRKAPTSCYYQLLSGHAAIGTYPHDKVHEADTNECWWCNGEPQSRYHLSTGCGARAPQAIRMWKDRGKVCGWNLPRAPWSGCCGTKGRRRRFSTSCGTQERDA